MLNTYQLLEIKGGGLGSNIMAALAGIVSFFAGLLDGFTRPYTCR